MTWICFPGLVPVLLAAIAHAVVLQGMDMTVAVIGDLGMSMHVWESCKYCFSPHYTEKAICWATALCMVTVFYGLDSEKGLVIEDERTNCACTSWEFSPG